MEDGIVSLAYVPRSDGKDTGLQGDLPFTFSLLSGFVKACHNCQGEDYSETCGWNGIDIFVFVRNE